MSKQFDALWINGLIVTCEKGYGLIENGAIAVKNGEIAWIGTMKDLGSHLEKADKIHDLQGRCLTPGLIDCHTHLVFAGNRSNEFEMRLKGATYAEISRQGGGIQSTVAATRAASEDDLFNEASKRVKVMIANGVTTLEIKSGYGLDWPTELKLLRVIQRIADAFPLTVQRTFLGAHTIPPEYKNKSEDYIDHICSDMIPMVARENLADAVDIFCEKIAFSALQAERVFKAATAHGLAVKCHAEQLSDTGSALLAAKYHALSVDHLEHMSSVGVKAISLSGTVAVLLPGAFYFLHETKLPPIDLLRHQKVAIALATDFNPGTSPILSLPIILNLACNLYRLTPEEALLGVTRNAAKALGLEKTHGTLKLGKIADFAIWDINHPTDLSYYLGGHSLFQLVKKGSVITPIKMEQSLEMAV